jgi:hypothetical protein
MENEKSLYEEWNHPVDAFKLVIAEDRENLARYPRRGTIGEDWGAVGSLASIVIGPRNLNYRLSEGFFGYLREERLCVESYLDLIKLAESQGLKVIREGERNMDGISVYHYSFVNPVLEAQREREREEKEARRIQLEAQRKQEEKERRKWKKEHPREYQQKRIEAIAQSNPAITLFVDFVSQYFENVEGNSLEEARDIAEKMTIKLNGKIENCFRFDRDNARRVYQLCSIRISNYLESRFDLPRTQKLDLGETLNSAIDEIKRAR